MTAKEYVEKLCSYGHRRSTTPNERRAAEWIFDRMKAIGLRDAAMEEFMFSKTFSWVHFYHYFGMGLAGVLSMLGLGPALVGLGLGLLVLVSYWGEGNTRFHLLRTLAPRGRSQNVIGKIGNPDSPVKIILMGHIDSTRSGLLFHPAVVNAMGSEKDPPAVFFIPFVLMCLLFSTMILRALGISHWILFAVQGVLMIPPAVGSLLMLQREIFGVNIPGASDNASGMGIIMELAERFVQDPPRAAEVWVVGSGCEEPHLGGALDFARKHLKDLDPQNTFFINFDTVACDPDLCYGAREGYILFYPYSPKLLGLAALIAREKFPGVRQVSMAAASDMLVMASRGFQSISFISLNKKHVPSNYHWHTDRADKMHWPTLEKAVDFGYEMARRLDAEYAGERTPSLRAQA